MFARLRGMLLHGFKVQAVPVTREKLQMSTTIISMCAKLFR